MSQACAGGLGEPLAAPTGEPDAFAVLAHILIERVLQLGDQPLMVERCVLGMRLFPARPAVTTKPRVMRCRCLACGTMNNE